ncbi:MAG: ATP12 family protein [Alphaproteobacteria bacterium]
MKRLYKLVSVSEVYELMLDGKPVKTPGGHRLIAPNRLIGGKLVGEWGAQDKEIVPATMPFTQFLSTKFDRVIPQRTEIEAAVLKYLDTDLLCYRTGHPPALAVQQAQAWDPWLVWFEERFGCRPEVTTSLNALMQGAAIYGKLESFIRAQDEDVFNILQFVTSVSGSLILAVGFIGDIIAPEQVFACMRVEESYKAGLYDEEKYGADPMQAKRDTSIRHDLASAAEFLKLL